MGGNENVSRYFHVLGGRRDLSGKASLKLIRNLWTKKNQSPGVILIANISANTYICQSGCQSRVRYSSRLPNTTNFGERNYANVSTGHPNILVPPPQSFTSS